MKDSTVKIYIGYDSRHPIASEVCEYSLRKHSKDLDIEHLKLSEVDKNLYWREYKDQSTEFTYTRFLVPYLQDYEGWALFCDNDFLFLDDVKKIFGDCWNFGVPFLQLPTPFSKPKEYYGIKVLASGPWFNRQHLVFGIA